MMNLFENNNEDPVLKSRIINWRKHVIGDCLPSRLYMNDITIEWLSIMFNQIIIILHRPIAEKDMVGEMCEPISDFSSRRSALFYKDNQFYYNETKCRETRTICPIFEWVNNGQVSFIWHKGLHYQAYSSNCEEQFYKYREFFFAKRTAHKSHCVWEYKINSTCPVCSKIWNKKNSTCCDSCNGCVHYECVVQDCYKKKQEH